MRFKRIICMLMITTLVSSCKSIHELVVTKKPTPDEIVLTEVEPGENNATAGSNKTEELPQEIAGHKVTYTDTNKTTARPEQPATIETTKQTSWLLIALIGLPPLLILFYVINKRIAKKLNETG